MGQRSQIYISVKDNREDKNYLIACYFQWNYSHYMISRARHLIEFIKDNIDYIMWEDYHKKLRRIAEINFDCFSVVLSHNINEEYKKYGDDSSYADYIFYHQDNNDGKLFIDVNGKEVKYAFVDYDCDITKPMTPKKYMEWDEGSDWVSGCDIEDISIINDNIKYIQDNAKLMTTEELNDFINRDYADKPKDGEVRITRLISYTTPVNKLPYGKIEVTDGTITKIVTIKQDNDNQYFTFNRNRYYVRNIGNDFPQFVIVKR